MSNTNPTQTPNVVVQNPDVRRVAVITLGVIGVVLGTVVTVDNSTPAFDISEITTPIFQGYAYLSSLFGFAVTLPNIPRR